MRMIRMSVLALGCSLAALSANAQNMTAPDSDNAVTTPGHSSGMTPGQGRMMSRGPAMSETRAGTVTPGQIASITSTVDTGEIKLANLALKKSQNPDVRSYAQEMIKDHSQMMTQGKQLYASLNIKPAMNATSRSLKSQADKNFAMLQKAKGAEFEKMYLQGNATMHGQVAALIEGQLIPSAQSQPQLVSYLQSGVQTVRTHEQHAQQLLQSLGSNPNAAMQ